MVNGGSLLSISYCVGSRDVHPLVSWVRLSWGEQLSSPGKLREPVDSQLDWTGCWCNSWESSMWLLAQPDWIRFWCGAMQSPLMQQHIWMHLLWLTVRSHHFLCSPHESSSRHVWAMILKEREVVALTLVPSLYMHFFLCLQNPLVHYPVVALLFWDCPKKSASVVLTSSGTLLLPGLKWQWQ